MTQPGIDTTPTRLTSLDAYRGFIMLSLVSVAFGLKAQAQHFGPSRFWDFIEYHVNHAPWEGCSVWDLVLPAFMFMVGVAMPYSYASRLSRGDSWQKMFAHALKRSLILVVLGIVIVSNDRSQTYFSFTNVLIQIGLGYSFVFLLLNKGPRIHLAVSVLVLFFYWLAFALYPLLPADFDYSQVGLEADWPRLTGFFAHWQKNTNIAADFDVWFLNLFPREEPFVYNSGGYPTLQFIPGIVTMLFGVMAGTLLRGERTPRQKLRRLLLAGVVCIVAGLTLGATVCPIIKRVCTPSFCLYSSGWVILMLAGFYWIIDIKGYRRWAFPLVVAGMNSIFLYCAMQLGILLWVVKTLKIHLGPEYLSFAGEYQPIAHNLAFTSGLWLICYWMYRQKIFIRI